MDPKTTEKEHDGKRGCGAKRFSGAHPLRRAFHVRSGWLFFLSDFKRRFAPVFVAFARAVFEKYDAGRVLVCRRASAGTCIKTSTRPAITIQSETNFAKSRDNITLHEYFVNFYDLLLPVTCLCGGKATKQSHHFGATVSTASEWETVAP